LKLYCASCGRLVGDVTGMIRRNAVMVCSPCYEKYKAADEVAKMAREQVQGEPTVNKLMGMFGMT
jgi:hypothetical protein